MEIEEGRSKERETQPDVILLTARAQHADYDLRSIVFMLKKYLFLSEIIFMAQKLTKINMDCSHGPNMSGGALNQGVVESPGGKGPW